LTPLALAFPAYGLETGTTPFLALWNEESLLLHIAQDTSLGYLFAKTPEQALLGLSGSQFNRCH
jgi:hypothetical protein